MSLEFKFRRVGELAVVSCNQLPSEYLNRDEVMILLEEFKEALDDLQWFIHVTDTGEYK